MKRKNQIRTLVRSKIYESIITKRMNASRLKEGDLRAYEADEFSWGECDISELDSDFLGFFTMWFEDRGKAESETREWLDPAFFKSLAGIAIYFTSFSLPPMGTVCDTLVNLSKIFTRGKQNVEMALNKNAGLDTSREREQQNRDKLSAKELKDQERAEKLRAKEAEGTLTAEQKAELKQLKADEKAGVKTDKQRKRQLQSMRHYMSSAARTKFPDAAKADVDKEFKHLNDFERVIYYISFGKSQKSRGVHHQNKMIKSFKKWKRDKIPYNEIIDRFERNIPNSFIFENADRIRMASLLRNANTRRKFENNLDDLYDIIINTLEKLKPLILAL